ncbi:DUF2911 domain-containing protein [Pedobacter flavus]|uniref:DUF2911 domain-containing protein n=1 Tax=Pedobacter flavus TaxID=3113906 RepID=A0ABU7H1R0_9SPHI|nr:DUF2911 domain-containing protein [Pedobacter sp. VNH31]MEE1884491.1 DUF2911 domain-containing protein [Pedobacter sp. VNH31]
MKKLLIGLLAMLCMHSTFAQAPLEIKYSKLDASPADILYFPLRAPNVNIDDNSTPKIKIVYSRPQKKEREVFGVMQKFDVVWRLGANENTEIKFYQPVEINGKTVEAGTYSFFAIPNPTKWTLILNKRIDRWGAFTYDSKLDYLRTDVPVQNLDNPVEALSMTFTESPEGANLYIAWDKTQVMLPIKVKK